MRIFLLSLFLFSQTSYSQNVSSVQKHVNKLASASMHGRGYVEDGSDKASKYIRKELQKAGLQSFEQGWFQPFQFSVNTFPDDVQCKIDDLELKPGIDFIVAPGSPPIEGSFEIIYIDRERIADTVAVQELIRLDFNNRFVVLDDRGMDEEEKKSFRQLQGNPFKAAGLIILKEKLTWGVSQNQARFPAVEMLYESWIPNTQLIELEIESELVKDFKARNVLAFVPGRISQDSFVVFTAHYDHLGMMGEDATFYGANDNASGVAVLLDLARHYHQNPIDYPVVFIFFAGEEAGLVGSEYYVKNPWFPIERIQVLINLDLLGNGSEGIMVVNGSVFPEDLALMQSINNEDSLVSAVLERGKAANSDHFFFTEAGVKAFFIYTLGGSKHYHDVFDKPDTISFDAYPGIFRLLTTYVQKIQIR